MSEPGPAADHATDAAALLAAWRDQGAHRHDPVRFHFIEALARRAAAHDGPLRALLDTRLARALQDFGQRLQRHGAAPAATPRTDRPLAELARELDRLAGSPGTVVPTSSNTATSHDVTTSHGLAAARPQADLKALRYFRSAWSRLGVDQQLKQSRAKAPDQPGPLNSHALVLRALTQMHELSPEYLARFMAHVEALMWLEQAAGSPVAAPREPARNAAAPSREAPRKSTRRSK